MVFQVLIIYFHNTFIILLYFHNTLSDIKKHHVISAVLSICSVIPKSVLNFSLFTSTLSIVFRMPYYLLLVCFCRNTIYFSRGPPENNVTSPETSNI